MRDPSPNVLIICATVLMCVIFIALVAEEYVTR